MMLLSTRGLSRRFGGLKAVDQVDFDLPEGQVRALIGPNGAGKTTFVGMLAGRLPASAGQVIFDGRDITALAAHQRIRAGMAYSFQITSIYANLTVAENIGLALGGLAGEAAPVAQALAQVGLDGRQDQRAGDLSYGHQRLLELAMGISQRPRLLILDEPTQGLADSEIAEFIALIRDLAGGMTILLIEHNIDVVMATADAITVMNSGRILAEGTPEAIRADAAVQAAYLGRS